MKLKQGIRGSPQTNKIRKCGYRFKKEIELRDKLRILFKKSKVTNIEMIRYYGRDNEGRFIKKDRRID